MQEITYVIIQLEEAKRYIQTNSVPYLRLALLLLDNAVEIQMHRTIEHELYYNDLYRRMQDTILYVLKTKGTPIEELPESLRPVAEMKLLTSKDKNAIDRFFEEKLKYLSNELPHMAAIAQGGWSVTLETTRYIDEPVAEVLRRLHMYRNEAYHRAKVRPETLATAALILFEINCDFLERLSGRFGGVYSPNDDYSRLLERYELSKLPPSHGYLPKIVAVLKSDLPVDDLSIKETLVKHLESRFLDLENSLEFIKENVDPSKFKTVEDILSFAQFWSIQRKRQNGPDDSEAFRQFTPEFTLKDLHNLKQRIPLILDTSSRIETFQLFASIEQQLEKIEPLVFEIDRDIDQYIQLQIDMRRGK